MTNFSPYPSSPFSPISPHPSHPHLHLRHPSAAPPLPPPPALVIRAAHLGGAAVSYAVWNPVFQMAAVCGFHPCLPILILAADPLRSPGSESNPFPPKRILDAYLEGGERTGGER
eukprot:CAMPEP_0175067306 /NCGR_PEP_ID=MMETSP0052_2-20121109/17022_1 /TAXON_ID=51329 ORGANISM="Polytomella parva, Strain SAG 63-3" /NCGR_SAMPLE_ID=MMETSP0052_2 /ASSEMBLY_ACC=CAM_ASM_000194 /LENGTH=114 /DNA_ID=CAMNT_0016334167 /DNA_START=24 /DNA_END=364 /DNA_ORIENTATION=+